MKSHHQIMKLSDLKEGDRCRILHFDHNPEVISRLHQLGLASGEIVTVISGAEGSNFLVAARQNRIALESRLTDAVTVCMLHHGVRESRGGRKRRWRHRRFCRLECET